MITAFVTLGFSLFDYFGYNLLGIKHETLYRTIQIMVQIATILLLVLNENILGAVLFIILWWTWCCDWFYYVIDYCSQKILGNSFEGGDSLQNVFSGEETVSWAWWTIYGLITGKRILSNKELIVQSSVGVIMTIILWLIL